jgi:phospholipid-binding lipoprotein MlaA
MFALNDALDHAIFEPVARGYRAVTPRPVRHGVINFLNNLRSPVVFANNLLQGHPGHAGATAARFGINSTIGLLGIFDPATSMGLARRDEDFGQTLGTWGAHPGPYLFLPIIGPTNLRDGIGSIVDLGFDPVNWADYDRRTTVIVTRGAVTAISTREDLLDSVDQMRRTSLDPYVSVRSGYSLLRESAIRNGEMQNGSDLQDIPEVDAPPSDAPPSDAPESQSPAGAATPNDHPPLNNIPSPSSAVSLSSPKHAPTSKRPSEAGKKS